MHRIEQAPLETPKPLQEVWIRPERAGDPTIRVRAESGMFEADFALKLAAVVRRGTGAPHAPDSIPEARLSWLEALRSGQMAEVVYRVAPGELHCTLRGRASARQADAAVGSARDLARYLLAGTTPRDAALRFSPLAAQAGDDVPELPWRVTARPAGLRILPRPPIGFAADTAASPAVLILPHPPRVVSTTLDALIGLDWHAPLEVVLSAEPVELEPREMRTLRQALHGLGSANIVCEDSQRDCEVHIPKMLGQLRAELERWSHHGKGLRVRGSLASVEALPEALLFRLGQVLLQGRPVSWARASHLRPAEDGAAAALDLRDAYPVEGALPALFPSAAALLAAGIRAGFPRLRAELPETGALLGEEGPPSAARAVRFAAPDRSRHCYLLGATGTGKSTLIYRLIMQDIEAGVGVCLLDPHGDLMKQVLTSVSPRRARDVIVINPADRERSVGLNLLECEGPHRDVEMNFAVNEMIRIFDRLYDLHLTGGPVFEQYMRNALLLVTDNDTAGATLVDIPFLFADREFRHRLLRTCRNPYVVNFWRKQAERAGGEAALENIAPYITSKLNQFTHNALLRPIIGQARSTISMRACMDAGRILLVHLPKGLLGELDARLLGMLVIGKIFNAALQRADVGPTRRPPFYLYIDEAHNFTTGTVTGLLAEARKFGLYLTLANQNLAQMAHASGFGTHRDGSLVEAILGNVGTLLLFRLGAIDAAQMEAYTRPELSAQDLQDLPDHYVVARLLVHGRPTRPFLFRTLPAAECRLTRAEGRAVQAALRQSRRATTRPIAEVEAAIRARLESEP